MVTRSEAQVPSGRRLGSESVSVPKRAWPLVVVATVTLAAGCGGSSSRRTYTFGPTPGALLLSDRMQLRLVHRLDPAM